MVTAPSDYAVGTPLALWPCMSRHWKGMVALLFLAIVGVIGGTFWSPYIALGAVFGMVVALFVLGTAWMRPRDGNP